MDIWVPIIQDKYELKREPSNKKDPNAVTIVPPGTRGRSREENQVGNNYKVLENVAKLMAIWLTKFLKRGTNNGKTGLKGKRVNRGGGYGLEVACEYFFTGDRFSTCFMVENKARKRRI